MIHNGLSDIDQNLDIVSSSLKKKSGLVNPDAKDEFDKFIENRININSLDCGIVKQGLYLTSNENHFMRHLSLNEALN